MKTRQVTIKEGELLGPIDWNYDFREHYKDFYNCSTPERHEEMFQQAMTILHMLEDAPDKYEATIYRGWPRCGWGEILAVGMYDGWPYWRPVPSVMLSGTFGSEWHPFQSITDLRVKGEQWPLKLVCIMPERTV